MSTDTTDKVPLGMLSTAITIATAVLVFRLVRTSLSLLVTFVEHHLPFGLMHWVHTWWFILFPAISISIAVLVARAAEPALRNRTNPIRVTSLAIITLLALAPVSIDIEAEFARPSPLENAIADGYPAETIGLIVDQYPDALEDSQALAVAAAQNRADVVKVLIEKNANIDQAVDYLMQMDRTNAVTLILKTAQEESTK